ncbi:DUF4394 domain-containing protein [Luteolibacter sp. GHJ8]|uniref:DUF4394 domain-containing protein n=1 Tax=Luteolibacter rhizosphaerae TaxID=2989719 RepID=A0ABT3FYP8_9BACT|nr:DUF4394 domain-containing protein [Luteolibacter rhizosphaerae]MCW1912705.1 DUF4394 domain-containing protein [Luteolibacter rhizosphaerae]
MKTKMILSLALLAATLAPATAQELLAGLGPKNKLVLFTSSDPGSVEVIKITGLPKGEALLGIDRRPATGQLYALGKTSRLYTINTETGAATAIGSAPFTPALSGTRFGFDFNPTVDRIRIVSNTGQNLRAHPDTGAIAFTDLNLVYANGDAAAGATPDISGSGYTNSVSPTPLSTTLFNIDAGRDTLVTQSPPNDGVLNTVGALGLNVTNNIGFDIAGSNGVAYASLQKKLKFGKSKRASLYTVNLTTGAATLVGPIAGPAALLDLTAMGSVATAASAE